MATEIAVETQHNFIGGKWVPSASGATFEDRNPADNDDVVGLFPKSDHGTWRPPSRRRRRPTRAGGTRRRRGAPRSSTPPARS